MTTERRYPLWFFLIALWVLAVGYGLRDPWPADEPRFVLVAKQMVTGGDWLFPHRGHELYPDKPPLYFWALALAYRVVGSWRWSFLLPSLLAGMGTLWLVFDLARRLWNPRAGLWAAAAVLSALQFVYQFKRAQIDPSLVFCTTLAFYGIARHALLGSRWRWYWLGCFAAGLGVVLKGVGFLPLLALAPLAWMWRRQWQGLAPLGEGNGWRWAGGAALFLVAIALWFVPMLITALADGDPAHRAYLHNLLFKQTATRYAEAWHHRQPLWYFGAIIAAFWLPFSLSFVWLWRDWREAWRARDARVWLPLAWALIVLAFFTASPGKRDMYILPALPAFAWAAAPYLEAWAQRPGARRALWGFAFGLGALLLLLGAVALGGHARFAAALADERGIGGQARGLWWMLVAVGGTAVVGALALRVRRAPQAVALTLLAVWTGYGLVAHPLLDASSSARGLMQQARTLAGPDIAIGLVNWKEQNLLQATGPTEEFGFLADGDTQWRRAAIWVQADPTRRRLLAQRDEGVRCVQWLTPGARVVGMANRREWWLLPAAAVARCAEPPR